jgi:lipoprotein-anchoring transpeptidase ErfK/SrfK
MMIQRFGIMLLALAALAALAAVGEAGSARAQYYPAPAPYYRSAPPPGAYDDRLPSPGYFTDDDDDDAPLQRPPRGPRISQMPQQGQSGAPSRILPYPADSGAGAPPPPGFVTLDGRPPYGHQLDAAPPLAVSPPSANDDPNVMRPPGGIGTGLGTTPQPIPPGAAAALPPEDRPEVGQPKELPENLKKQLVDYSTKEPAGTVVVDTPNTYLYLVLGNGKAIRYGIGVGREGFTWAGTERISKMSEWPDWHPPSEMIERQPYLPRFMAGGPGNPLGARALYLGKTLYRIHGTNQPSTIGQTVSSGCIRLINEDVEDLFSRVQTGSRVVVLPGRPPDAVANSGNPPPMEPANPMVAPSRPGTAISGSPLPPVR